MIRIRSMLPFIAAALAGVAILGTPGRAKAAFQLKIFTPSNGAGTFINDGGPGDLDGAVNNQISFNYNDASYNIVGSLAFTNSPGTAGLAHLDVNYTLSTLNLTGGPNGTGGAGSLSVSATGFTQPSG